MQPGIRITRAEVETLGGFLMAARGAIAIRHPAAATSAIDAARAILDRVSGEQEDLPAARVLMAVEDAEHGGGAVRHAKLANNTRNLAQSSNFFFRALVGLRCVGCGKHQICAARPRSQQKPPPPMRQSRAALLATLAALASGWDSSSRMIWSEPLADPAAAAAARWR